MTSIFSTKAKLLVLTLAMTVAMVAFAFNANYASAGNDYTFDGCSGC